MIGLYLIFDPLGVPSTDPYTILCTWPQRFGWPTHPSHIGPSLPQGCPGHGGHFDLLIMFTSHPLIDAIGFTWIEHNVIVINLYYVISLHGYNDGFVRGYSVIMHEAGHAYGCEGDTFGVHYDVMDYWWGLFQPWSFSFDSYHQSIIEQNRGIHSD